VGGLPGVALMLERVFVWLFRLSHSVLPPGSHDGIISGWVLGMTALALLQSVPAWESRPRHALDRAIVRGVAVGLGLGVTSGAVVTGIMLIPSSVSTLLVGLGMFGAVPFAVALLLLERAREIADLGPRNTQPYSPHRLVAMAFGLILAWAIPVLFILHNAGQR
jgi:hypothetical protein